MMLNSNLLVKSAQFAVSVGSLSCLFAAQSEAATFRYREVDHPAIVGRECADFALERADQMRQNIGARFGLVTIKDAYCVSNPLREISSNWNVEIEYDADEALPLVSIQDATAIEQFAYTSAEACNADIAKEVEFFERNTMLPVFAAYCQSPLYDSGYWYLNVSGFGHSDARPYTVSTSVFGSILDYSRESFVAQLTDAMKTRGADVSRVGFNNRLAYFTLLIRYYGQSKIELAQPEIARFATKEICRSNLDVAKVALAAAGVPSLVTYCYQSSMPADGFGIAFLTDREDALSLVKSSQRFQAFDACEAQRPAVVSHYRDHLHRDIKGSFCTRGDEVRQYHIVMIEKRA